MMTAKKGL